VLPLWPETIYVGLFPGHCWLQRGRKALVQEFTSSSMFDPSDLLRTLEKILVGQAKPLRKGSRLVITVSDSLASIAPLPWQEDLRRPVEIESYARICFEKLGMTVADDWVMRAEFRHFGGMGLAYALPRVWLEALLELVATIGLRVIEVLPISAAAFYKQELKKKNGTSVLLLQEMNRISAIIYDRDGLRDYDVEPFARSIHETRLRLLRRVGTAHANIARVSCWSTDASETIPPAEIIASNFPDAESTYVKRDTWK
jgi:hypothetical protein